MTVKSLNERGINLNTLLLAISILGAVTTAVLFIAPLKTLPEAQERIQNDVGEMKRTQAVQTEALKTLAEVAKDSRENRERSIRHDTELGEVKRRLDRLESR